jgi:hypothetical protein
MFQCSDTDARTHSGDSINFTILNEATGESVSVTLCVACSAELRRLAKKGKRKAMRRPASRPRGIAGLRALVWTGDRKDAPKPTL